MHVWVGGGGARGRGGGSGEGGFIIMQGDVVSTESKMRTQAGNRLECRLERHAKTNHFP